MENLKLLAVVTILLFGCTKSKNDVPAKTDSMQFIHFWKADTFIAELSYCNPYHYDTMYSSVNNDTSFIIYRGQKLYVWAVLRSSVDRFNDSGVDFLNCYVGATPFDTANAYSNCEVTQSQYWNAGAWAANYMQVNLRLYGANYHVHPPFDSCTIGTYMSLNK